MAKRGKFGYDLDTPSTSPSKGGGEFELLPSVEGRMGGVSKSIMRRRFNRKEQTSTRQELRKRMTPAEVILWNQLRGRAINGFKFRRQFGIGAYIVDFYCPDARLVIEVDGDSHFIPGATEQDRERERFIEQHGIRIVRFTNHEVKEGLDSVMSTIADRLTPSISPSAEGERS